MDIAGCINDRKRPKMTKEFICPGRYDSKYIWPGCHDYDRICEDKDCPISMSKKIVDCICSGNIIDIKEDFGLNLELMIDSFMKYVNRIKETWKYNWPLKLYEYEYNDQLGNPDTTDENRMLHLYRDEILKILREHPK